MQPLSRANYEVIRQLGEGGVGRVYEAVHFPSGRAVAIKTLRTEHGTASSQRLLLNEAAAAAQLAHPGIVELIDVGRDERGAMFLVMELVRGSSLDTWSASFPGLSVVLRAFDEILDALAAAHAQGIVHGDLKPGNVLLDEHGRVKLTDFGIAHVIDPLRVAERRGVQGTPYYMAPEQLVDLESIGPPTDIYALGVMLYELVAGREPYASEGTLGEMVARKMIRIEPLVPRRGLAVPRELVSLVMAMLDPDPRLRPRFAAHVQRALASAADDVRDEGLDAVVPRSLATWVESPLGSAPTITSSNELPQTGGSTRSLPFTLPCAAGHSPEVALHRLRPLPLLGRDDQTARLMALASEVARGGGVRGLVVSGRAGEGKTRLLRHGFAEVERTGTMIGAAASFDDTIANAQVGLRAGIARLVGSPLRTLEDTLASRWRWLTRAPQPDVDFARMHEWLSPGASMDADVAAAVAAMCVRAASRIYPVYLWLDDVAWSRDGAMELMVRLLESNDARALVVGTLRSGTAEHPTARAWLLRTAKAGAHFEMLPPLLLEDRIALACAAGPVAPEVAAVVAEKIDAPALVLVETVRSWIDEGFLVPTDRGCVLREGAIVSELAARTGGSVLARRIATLLDAFGTEKSAAERVLCHAALLGLRFEDRVLRSCAGAAPHVDRVLDRALLSGVLRVDGRGAYRFEHRLFLDAIVERCGRRTDAASIFRATADALVAAYGRRSVDSALAVAMLYRAGGDRDAAAIQALDATRALCRASLFAAAGRAIDLCASWVQADALPELHRHNALLARARGLLAYFELDYATARSHLLVALGIFEALGDTADVHAVSFDLSSAHFYEDHYAEAMRYVRVAEGPGVDVGARARAHHRLAELASLRCDLTRAIWHQRQACDDALASTDPHFLGVSLATLSEILLAAGEVEEGARVAERANAIAERLADRQLLSDSARGHATLDVARGYYAAARARIVPRMSELVARGDTWHVTADRALVLVCTAALDESPEIVETAIRAFVDAYAKVPHDEPFTWWCARAAQAFLSGNGYAPGADEVGALIDARMERIAIAFTEDAAARSNAVTRASIR